MATDPRDPPGRSPASGSSTARRSSPARTRTMLLADLGADVDQGRAARRRRDARLGPAVGRPSGGRRRGRRRTALAVNRNKRWIRLDLRQPAGAEGAAPPPRRRRRPRRELPARRPRPARVRRRGARGDQPAPHPPRDHRLRPDAPDSRPPRLRLRHPGRVRADVDHRRDATPTAAARRRSASRSPTSSTGLNGAVGDPRGARAAASCPASPADDGDRASGSTCRCSARRSPCSSTRPRTRSSAALPRAGSATPTRTSSRTRRSRRPTATIAVAVGSERQWPRFCRALGLPALADDPRFATNGDRVANRAELIATLRRALRRAASGEWLAALDAAEIPAGPINDIAAAFASPWAAGRDGRARASAARPDDARSARRSSCPRRRPRSGPRRRCSASTPTRSSPSSATTPAVDRGAPSRRGDLSGQSSWRRNDSQAIATDAPMRAIVATTGPTAASVAGDPEGERPRRRAASPVGRNGAIAGTRRGSPIDDEGDDARARPRRALERVSVLPRNVIAAQAISASHWRTAAAANAGDGSGSNRTSV